MKQKYFLKSLVLIGIILLSISFFVENSKADLQHCFNLPKNDTYFYSEPINNSDYFIQVFNTDSNGFMWQLDLKYFYCNIFHNSDSMIMNVTIWHYDWVNGQIDYGSGCHGYAQEGTFGKPTYYILFDSFEGLLALNVGDYYCFKITAICDPGEYLSILMTENNSYTYGGCNSSFYIDSVWNDTTNDCIFEIISSVYIPYDIADFSEEYWRIVSLPYNQTIPIYQLNLTDGTTYYTYNNSIDVIIGNCTLYYNSSSYTYERPEYIEPTVGYWMFFYDMDYYPSYNYTIPSCGNTSLTKYQNIVNATGTHQSVYSCLTGWRIWANYSSYANFYKNIVNATGTLQYTVSNGLYKIWANYTGNATSGIFWINYTDSNVTINTSISLPSGANTTSYNISENNWLSLAGLNLDPETIYLLIWVMFVMAILFSKNKFIYLLSALFLLIQIIVIQNTFTSTVYPYIIIASVFFATMGLIRFFTALRNEKVE